MKQKLSVQKEEIKKFILEKTNLNALEMSDKCYQAFAIIE